MFFVFFVFFTQTRFNCTTSTYGIEFVIRKKHGKVNNKMIIMNSLKTLTLNIKVIQILDHSSTLRECFHP